MRSIAALRLAADQLRAALHRFHDVDIAGAAAEVAFEAVDDLVLGRVGIVLQQPRDRHDHARRAEAALERMTFGERALHGMQLAILGETLDRHDVGAVRLHREHRARLHRAAVQMHRAAAALARVAADVRAREPESVADEVNQQRALFDFARLLPAVYDDFDFGHFYLPPA